MLRVLKQSKVILGIGLAILFGALLVFGQPPVKLVDGNNAEVAIAAAGKKYESGLVTIGATETTIASVTTKVQGVWCSVPATTTLVLKDGNGSEWLPTGTSITGPSALLIVNTPMGFTWTNGVKGTSGSGNVKCAVVGVQ